MVFNMAMAVVQNNDDHDNRPVRMVARFKVQIKLHSVSQSIILHVYCHCGVLGALGWAKRKKNCSREDLD